MPQHCEVAAKHPDRAGRIDAGICHLDASPLDASQPLSNSESGSSQDANIARANFMPTR
jgi:hypothetical protein